MKKLTVLTILFLFLFIGKGFSQFILGGQISLLTGASGDKNGQFGIGIQGKAKIANKVAVGGNLRTYFKNFTETSIPTGGTIRTADAITPLTGMIEYYFGRSIQPYLGLDAGLYFNSTIVESSQNAGGSVDITEHDAYFGVGPKLGLQINSGFVSPFFQAQYHVLFGGGDEIEIPGFNETVTTHDKFWTFDAGILFQIGNPGGKQK